MPSLQCDQIIQAIMGSAVEPVFDLPVANDPGQSALGVTIVTRRKASGYHDVDAINAMVEIPLCLESQCAGEFPKTSGYPDIKFTSPVLEGINPNK